VETAHASRNKPRDFIVFKGILQQRKEPPDYRRQRVGAFDRAA
jgi:hypothetical protein